MGNAAYCLMPLALGEPEFHAKTGAQVFRVLIGVSEAAKRLALRYLSAQTQIMSAL